MTTHNHLKKSELGKSQDPNFHHRDQNRKKKMYYLTFIFTDVFPFLEVLVPLNKKVEQKAKVTINNVTKINSVTKLQFQKEKIFLKGPKHEILNCLDFHNF